jgi:hypothetical protein
MLFSFATYFLETSAYVGLSFGAGPESQSCVTKIIKYGLDTDKRFERLIGNGVPVDPLQVVPATVTRRGERFTNA